MVALLSLMAATIPFRSPRMRVISAASIATSAPVPMANPTSAVASAGASLMPSPTMPTILPSFFRAATFSALCSGSTSASTFVIPIPLAIARAARSLSPVIIHTSIPSFCRSAIAWAEFSFTVSATAINPLTVRSTANSMTVFPCCSSRSISVMAVSKAI